MEKTILTANQILYGRYKGSKNFVTPKKRGEGKLCSNMAYELSSGPAILRSYGRSGEIFGVSIVIYTEKGEFNTCKLSQSFSSLDTAKAYIKSLKAYFKAAEKNGDNIEEAIEKF